MSLLSRSRSLSILMYKMHHNGRTNCRTISKIDDNTAQLTDTCEELKHLKGQGQEVNIGLSMSVSQSDLAYIFKNGS